MTDLIAGISIGAGAILLSQFAFVMWKMRDWRPKQ